MNAESTITLKGYCRPAELSAMLHVPPRTIRHLQSRGVLPYLKLSHKLTLFRLADVEKALSKFEVNPLSGVRL